MTSRQIRRQFLDFFASKGHKIIPSAPMVAKSDPTLMFINSGMAPLKDFFLGNQTPPSTRIADTQKCLRVSGKHNDLEDVGFDGYHHTMFEMLGNWSFGDYFKKDALEWSWELLTDVYKIPKDRLYVSVFGGNEAEGVPFDQEAYDVWRTMLPEDRIMRFGKKENFWEMGETGPCGPCSEIHVDLRSDAEREKTDGRTLVNADDPNVIEVWNNVFMQFVRKADGSLEELPAKSVDTGMGFERLCRAVQGTSSNYSTDLWKPIFNLLGDLCGHQYQDTYPNTGQAEAIVKKDIAMRVVADHLRAVSFAIADGELPSNTGAGYVIRRILRRAVRYYYSFLDMKEPVLYRLFPVLAREMDDVFPELVAQQEFIVRVLLEEEKSFLRTLELGLSRSAKMQHDEVCNNLIKILQENGIDAVYFDDKECDILIRELNIALEYKASPRKETIDKYPFHSSRLMADVLLITDYDIRGVGFMEKINNRREVKLSYSQDAIFQFSGSAAFELLDTYGFPIDLTRLIAREQGYTVDDAGFDKALAEQKARSRKDAAKQVGDWMVLRDESDVEFVGYDLLETNNSYLTKYRIVFIKEQSQCQLVLNRTPFYPEGGGQVGDTGYMLFGDEKIRVLDTKKENTLIIHIVDKFPEKYLNESVVCRVDESKRRLTESNHSATHLLHAALRQVLGTHVQQKGSYLDDQTLRFDFQHFQKVSDDELARIETIVNLKIRENIKLDEARNLPIEEAKASGAMMLFGEKYGETVRMITFDPGYSRELCGGCHVRQTGQIGYFKITTETAVAAGVRRIEAVTAAGAEQWIDKRLERLSTYDDAFKNPRDPGKAVADLYEENKRLQKALEHMVQEQANGLREGLRSNFSVVQGVNYLAQILPVSDANAVKNLAVELEREIGNAIIVFGAISADGKPSLTVKISDALVKEKGLNAGNIVRELAQKFLKGGGGGQPGFATAGGTEASGLQEAVDGVKGYL